jgi:hypothetical protein
MAITQSPSQLGLTTNKRGTASDFLLVTDPGDTGIEVLRSRQQFDIHPEKIDRKIATVKTGETDRILFRGNDRRGPADTGVVNHLDDLLLGIPVVIGKLNPLGQKSPEMLEFPLKANGGGNAGDGGHGQSL